MSTNLLKITRTTSYFLKSLCFSTEWIRNYDFRTKKIKLLSFCLCFLVFFQPSVSFFFCCYRHFWKVLFRLKAGGSCKAWERKNFLRRTISEIAIFTKQQQKLFYYSIQYVLCLSKCNLGCILFSICYFLSEKLLLDSKLRNGRYNEVKRKYGCKKNSRTNRRR